MIGCRAAKPQLGAYVDGELTGAERQELSRHLGACAACAHEVKSLGRLGQVLRGAVSVDPVVVGFEGLAAGVVTRVRAEAAQTWQSKLRRAVADCRWLLVGTGSIAGSLATTALVVFLLGVGPGPTREDSLAALIRNLCSPAGALFVVGATDDVSRPSLIYVSGRLGPPTWVALQDAVFAGPTDSELARQLSDTVVREGEIVELSAMAAAERADAVALMDVITRRSQPGAVPLRGGSVSVSQVRLVTSTGVSVKGL